MLDLEPIKQRLAEAKRQRPYEEADRHEAKSRAWSSFYQYAPSDVELLVSEVERLRSSPLIRVGPNADTLAFSYRRQEEKGDLGMTADHQPRAVTVTCTAEDMNICYCSEPAYHAAELRAALQADDPEHLRSAVEIAAAYLDKLAELEHQTVKGPLPGQEIKLADLDSLPQGAVFADNTGDLWVRETTGWQCYERLDSIDPEEDFQPFIYQAQI